MTESDKFKLLREWAKEHKMHLAKSTDSEMLQETWFSYSNTYIIHSVPREIDSMKNLKRFWLQNVGLKTLPDTICNITSINELSVDRNELAHLPDCLGRLRKLAYLDIEDNQLTHLPKSIEKLKHLLMLRANKNKITTLPKNIGKLKNLDRLFIANNPIEELPESLQECTSLEHLDLRGTNIKIAPKWLEDMPSLRQVYGFDELTLHFQKLLKTEPYGEMQITFRECFDQDMAVEDIEHKKGGIIGDEAMPLGRYIWSRDGKSIEYYVQWLPHYRGDSHGIIYKDGRHESLITLPQIGKVTKSETKLRAELKKKGLLDLW